MQPIATTIGIFLISAALAAPVFPDVPEHHPHFEGIQFVKNEDIVAGYPNGLYKPDNSINRAEYTKIIITSQYFKEEIASCNPSTLPFPDIQETAWYAPYVCVAHREGIIEGYDDGTFKPENTINVAEAAKIIVTTYLDEMPSDTPWYKPYMLILEKLHAIPTDIQSVGHPLSRGQMAEIVYRILDGKLDRPSQTYAEIEG